MTDEEASTPSPSRFEYRVAVIGFVAFSGVALSSGALQDVEVGGAASSDPALAVLKAVAFIYGLWGIARSWRSVRLSWQTAIVGVLHVLAFASALWSDAPRLTIARSIQLTLTTLFAVTVAARFSRNEIAQAFNDALWITIGLTFAALIIIPDMARMTGEFEGAWRGLFSHKNQLGKFAVMSAAMLSFHRGDTRARWRSIAGIACALILVVGSTSRTAMVSVLAVWACFPLYRYLRRQRSLLPHAIALSTLLGTVATVLWAHAGEIAEFLGRDLTLSGRTALWFAVIAFISQRPLLGYGYAAFWRGMEGNSAYISLALHWDVPHAHNGLLDVGLDLGAVGMILMALFFFGTIRTAFRAASEIESRSALWPLTAMTVVFMANLTESSLLRPNNLTWVLLLLAARGGLVHHLLHQSDSDHARLDQISIGTRPIEA